MADSASQVHAFDGPWFDAPEADYRVRAHALSNRPEMTDIAARFREKGWLVHDFGFAEDDLAAAAAYTRAIGSGRVQDAWLVNRAVRRLAQHPAVIAFLSELYQRPAFPFQTLNFPRGTQQGVHSDTWHFNSQPQGFMCGVWVALEDIEAGSGPLLYYSGSQRLPIFSAADVKAKASGDYNRLMAETVTATGLAPETALLRRGQALIWAANLFHGGSAITRAGATRLSQVSHYYFEGCHYFTPQLSDPEAGHTFWREPYNLMRNRFMDPPGAKPRPGLGTWIERKLRRLRMRPKAD
jgi:hypothetical protein